MAEFVSESELANPLVSWLRSTGRLRRGALLASELRWFGRRVDLVTLTRSRCATAYELKLNGSRRAIVQAAYNRLAFDRTFVVTAVMPSFANLATAADAGVGVILIPREGERPRVILGSSYYRIEPRLRRRLLTTIREVGRVH